MCLLFLNLDDNPSPGRYAVVIANNRDEFWDRPTDSANFWPSNPDCISGLDAEPGKEGGTWLGLSKHGKFASLLNILSSQQDPNKLGRGHLVTKFLTSADSRSYLSSVFKEADKYNGFNLVTLDIRPGFKFNLTFLSNWKPYYTEPVTMAATGVHAFGNCRLDPSWKKVDAGKERFRRIVKEHGSVENKEPFLKELLQMLSDKTRHLPDECLEAQGSCLPEDLRTERAAINVWSPAYRYGTRTNTVILIDEEGHCDYIERTLKTPVDPDSPQWQISRHSFNMEYT